MRYEVTGFQAKWIWLRLSALLSPKRTMLTSLEQVRLFNIDIDLNIREAI